MRAIEPYILTIVTFLPLLGSLVLVALDRRKEGALRWTSLVFASLTFLVSLYLFFAFKHDKSDMQFLVRVPWVKSYGISYHLGIDGISLLLVLLTTFLSPIVLLSSWRAITNRLKEYVVCMLLLETGMIGVFVALDLVLFYVFWEAMLIPMALLIGVWGGPRRIYAAAKFMLYTMAGSLLMLVAILALYYMSGKKTFDLVELMSYSPPGRAQMWLFVAFGLAFAIKVPMFPFHTWLPDAHVEAPTAGSVILAGVLLKMGTYGFLRFCLPLFPEASVRFVPLMCLLAVIGILYGALVSMAQRDIKKLVAFSSVSHLGFVMLGLFAFNTQGISGGLIQMINHGLSTGALFLIVGLIYERRHTRQLEDFGGLWKQMPVFAAFFLVVTLSSVGLPGLNGFVGEFLILVGAFKTRLGFAIFATFGIVLAAVYMLRMFRTVMFGELDKPENQTLPDLSNREVLVLFPIALFIVWIGVYPKPFLMRMEASVKQVEDKLRSAEQKLEQERIQRELPPPEMPPGMGPGGYPYYPPPPPQSRLDSPLMIADCRLLIADYQRRSAFSREFGSSSVSQQSTINNPPLRGWRG